MKIKCQGSLPETKAWLIASADETEAQLENMLIDVDGFAPSCL